MLQCARDRCLLTCLVSGTVDTARSTATGGFHQGAVQVGHPYPARLMLFQQCRAPGAAPGACYRCSGWRGGLTWQPTGATSHLFDASPVQKTKTLIVQVAEQGVSEAKSGAGVTRGSP